LIGLDKLMQHDEMMVFQILKNDVGCCLMRYFALNGMAVLRWGFHRG
jgi:hypothetical protein